MEGVLLGQVSHLCEPGMLQAMVEHVGAMLPKDVGGAKQCDHEEEAKLSHMEDGWCRECARQEIDCRGGCAGVQALESLQGNLLVSLKAGDFRRGEDKGGQATVEARCTVDSFNPY